MLYFNTPSEITEGKISPLTYRYFFECASFYFLEVRNYGDEIMDNNSQWFMIQKSNLEATALNLRFVDASTLVEERYFEEGYLKFNHAVGTYIKKYNSAQYGLTQIATVAIPTLVHQAVADFIKS